MKFQRALSSCCCGTVLASALSGCSGTLDSLAKIRMRTAH